MSVGLFHHRSDMKYPVGRPIIEAWWRVYGHTYTSGVVLEAWWYPVCKTTEKGVWLMVDTFLPTLIAGDMPKGDRFVLRDARKRFACPTVSEALESFIARKQRHSSILQAQISAVEYQLDVARDCLTSLTEKG